MPCQSTGGFTTCHRARLDRVAGWDTQRTAAATELVRDIRFCRQRLVDCRDQLAEFEAQAAPLSDQRQVTPRRMRLTDRQAVVVQEATTSGGRVTVTTLRSDARRRRTVETLVRRGLLHRSGSGRYEAEYRLTHVGWQVSRRSPAGRVCDTCSAPETVWDVRHPLYRDWADQCPLCIQADIEDDARFAVAWS